MKALHQALATVLTLAFFVGCAQDVGDINRVQPNFVRKADFEGEWYIRQTVADVGPMADFTFKGMQLEMDKVRWEITENLLIAYRAHERYPGLNPLVDHDAKRIGDTPQQEGVDDGHYSDFYKDAPIAAYRIQTHFDIQRQYNPATGEQTNVIMENMSDRPWHEREFMRVDWSQNQISNLTGDILKDDIRWPDACPSFIDLAQYIPADMDGDWAFKMEKLVDGDEWAPHIYDPTDPDFYADDRPDYVDFTNRIFVQPPMLQYPLGDGTFACIAACYLISGYNDCTSQEIKVRTSILRVPEERTFHPRPYSEHDMMKFGYFRTERKLYHRRLGERDQGFLRYASIHDIWETAYDSDGEVLPYAERQPKPIYYTLSAGYPEELTEAAERIAADWSRAFARAVAGAQQRSLDSVMADFPTDDGNGNYVNEGLFRINYNEDGRAQVGDLRYNFMYWVDNPHIGAPLGYGPSSADPETGEIISAQAFIYGASLDTYAQHGMEVVQALMGEYDVDELTRGEDIRRLMEEYTDNVAPRGIFKHSCQYHGLDEMDLHEIPLDEIRLENNPKYEARFEAMRQIGLDDALFEGRESRLKRLEGTPFESMMVNNEIRAALPSLDLATSEKNAQVVAAARPHTTDIFSTMRMDRIRQDWAGQHSVWLNQFDDPAVFGLAMYIKERMEEDGWTHDDAYQYIRQEIFASVMTHEVGHTVGLRHNFQGTFDSINYFDEYWDLRGENLRQTVATVGDLQEMSTPTQNQIDGRMGDYQYSSVMDYTGRFSNDMQGLGRYDEAAIIFAYGGAVEVFDSVGSQFRDRYFRRYSDGSPLFEDRLSPAYEHILDVKHYTRIPYLMGDGDPDLGIERMRQRRLLPYSTVKEMRDPSHPQHDNRWVEVPYMFCTDHERGLRGSCHPWVMGADLYEQARFLIDGWKNYYWLSHFRRDRWGWMAQTRLQASFNRFAYLPNFYQHWLWGVHVDRTVTDVVQRDYMMLAAVEGVNFLAEVLSTPTYGSYYHDEDTNTYQWSRYYSERPDADLFVQRGVGRRPMSRYDVNAGLMYHWYQEEAGHFWDYIAALFALSEATARVAGVDTQADFQSFHIPYYIVWNEQIDRLYGGIFAFNSPPTQRVMGEDLPGELSPGDVERARTFAPRLIDGEIVHRPLFDMLNSTSFDDDIDPYPDDPIVVPYQTSSQRLYALIYGMFGFTSLLDLDFAEQHRIFRLGTGREIQPAEGWELITFSNPFSGVQYGALHNPDAEKKTAAVMMIEQAHDMENRVAAGEPEWRLTQIVDWLEVMAGIADIYGEVR